MNINKTSSGGWFGRDGLEEKAKSGWGGQGGLGGQGGHGVTKENDTQSPQQEQQDRFVQLDQPCW